MKIKPQIVVLLSMVENIKCIADFGYKLSVDVVGIRIINKK
jgi:hypothetical protein